MQTIFFVRHGQTDWNAEGRFQGHSDIPLNATGLSQAHHAARMLAACPIDRVVASPLVRAARTAEIVNERLGKPIVFGPHMENFSEIAEAFLMHEFRGNVLCRLVRGFEPGDGVVVAGAGQADIAHVALRCRGEVIVALAGCDIKRSAKAGVGFIEIVTAPFPPYDPLFTNYLAPAPVYPDNYMPDLLSDSMFATDTSLGFSGGELAPHVPGSKFGIFNGP